MTMTTPDTKAVNKNRRKQVPTPKFCPTIKPPIGRAVQTTAMAGKDIVVFDSGPFFLSQTIFFAFSFLGFVVNFFLPTFHYHVDFLGSMAFVAAALFSVLNSSVDRVRISGMIVTIWSLKLAAFLVSRVVQRGHDARLDKMLAHPVSAAGFWTFSFLCGSLFSLSHTLGSTSTLPGSPILLFGGVALSAIGLVVETVADYQKWMFRTKHPRGFCNDGLWSISQHPNYFGELIIWSGVLVMNVSALIEPVAANAAVWETLWSYQRAVLTLISPLFVWMLLYGHASGSLVPENFEATRKKYGYGENRDYTAYVDTTPLIIPSLQSIFSKT